MNQVHKIFEGKKALVIGGTGGIGLEIARGLLNRGAVLTVQGRHKNKDIGIKSEKLDILDYDFQEHDFESLAESSLIKCAHDADILCVCYGPFLQKTIDEMTVTEWKTLALFDYALPGIFVSAVLKNMMKKRWGRILLFGGTGTDRRSEFLTNAAYAGAKTAVGTLVHSTAFAYADYGITCNALLPGFTKTEYSLPAEEVLAAKMPMQTMIAGRSVADSGMFLLENPDLNGVLLPVDRGWSPIKKNT